MRSSVSPGMEREGEWLCIGQIWGLVEIPFVASGWVSGMKDEFR